MKFKSLLSLERSFKNKGDIYTFAYDFGPGLDLSLVLRYEGKNYKNDSHISDYGACKIYRFTVLMSNLEQIKPGIRVNFRIDNYYSGSYFDLLIKYKAYNYYWLHSAFYSIGYLVSIPHIFKPIITDINENKWKKARLGANNIIKLIEKV